MHFISFFNGLGAVFWREYLIFKKRFFKQILAWLIMPILYLVAFHYALGESQIQQQPYSHYLLVGLMAMNSMMQSWAIASDINISRFYWHTFEEFQTAPITPFAYVAGEVLAGISRAILAALLVWLVGFIGGLKVDCFSLVFWAAVFLNAFLFSCLAVGLAMRVKAHADQAMLTSFVITPMAFLSGTFFPLERLPKFLSGFLKLSPLSHANKIMQGAVNQNPAAVSSLLILTLWGVGLFIWAVYSVKKTTE